MKKVVVLGGGTGNFTVLSALKNQGLELAAIVSMADDGGSTGILRDELGVLPPGDIRQCLVALSNSGRLMRDLMNYRFNEGTFKGHSFGNLLLCTLEKTTGNFETAIEEVGKILAIKGKVIPVTTNDVRLFMELNDGKTINGEGEIYNSEEIHKGYKKIFLEPTPTANSKAVQEILSADLLILGPGGLYSSLIPLLLVPGISRALRDTKAKKVFIMNLMNKLGQTPNYTTADYMNEISKFVGGNVFDLVLVNNTMPSSEILELYSHEASPVKNSLKNQAFVKEVDLISDKLKEVQAGDNMKRNLIRHDQKKLAGVLMQIVNHL